MTDNVFGGTLNVALLHLHLITFFYHAVEADDSDTGCFFANLKLLPGVYKPQIQHFSVDGENTSNCDSLQYATFFC